MIQEAPDPRYVAAWRQYRWRLALALAAWLTLLLLAVLAISGSFAVPGWMIAPLVIAWLVLLLATGLRLTLWPCPRCGAPFFIWNRLARRCFSCQLPIWSSSPGDGAPSSDAWPIARPPHIQAEVRFLTRAQGGRESPVLPGYRGQLRYDDQDWDATFTFEERDLVRPGDTAITSIWFVSPGPHRGRLHRGKSVDVREGQRVIAQGVVIRLLALQAPAVAERKPEVPPG